MSSTAPDYRHVWIVISADEDYADITIADATRRVSGTTPKETRRLALDAATAHAAAQGGDVVIEARDATGTWRLLATAEGVVRALPASRGHKERPARRLPRAALLGAAGLAVAVVAAVAVAAALGSADPVSGEGEDTDVAPSPQELTGRAPPPGFQGLADWALPLADGVRPGVAPDGGALALVDEESLLRVVDPHGETLWSREFEPGTAALEAPLRFVSIGEEALIVAETGDALWLWPVEGGTPAQIGLPPGAEVTYAGPAPLITTAGRVLVPDGDRPVEVEAPDEARPLAFDGEAVLFSLPVGTWQWREPEGDTRGVGPEPPDNAAESADPMVLTASAEYVVVGWQGDDGSPLAAVHDAGDGAVVGVGQAPEGVEDGTARWQAAEGWGAYDSLLVDFEGGETEELPGFRPRGAAGEEIYGERDGVPVAVGPDGEPRELVGDVARPWGLLDGRAVVVAGGEVYALPAE